MSGQEELSGCLRAAPIDDGCCIRVEGHGTMRQSRCLLDVAARTFAGCAEARVVIDLSACDYLDSTFLGCLLTLYRDHGRGPAPRFFIAATPGHREELLGLTKLDQILPALDEAPAADGPWVEIQLDPATPRELAEHVMACHRKLAETASPMAGTFARIADQIQRELAAGA